MKKYVLFVVLLLAGVQVTLAQAKEKVLIVTGSKSGRVQFGAGKLQKALQQKGYSVSIALSKPASFNGRLITLSDTAAGLKKEGFVIRSATKGYSIQGADASGVLYGCYELAERVTKEGKLPVNINFADAPEMVLRGACIGVQKPYYLPGRHVYEYPYTPETFPWFYDKQLWVQYLDSLAENRMNSLYLWNGHPFASLVKLKDYPYAVEVSEETFKKNEEMYRFLTEEADKRGIWVIQMFYNIIVSKPFAEYHNIKTQDRNRPIIPLIADYTRKSIAAFVEKYPNVGLMVCLGEAMEGVGNDDIEWFTKTIIPGMKDGLQALGKTEEPPIVLRAHDVDAPAVIKAAKPLYHNLYTEAKFNGEALTTYQPRGKWAELHRTLSRAGSVHIENVHILANLEPFRYGSADFIQKSVQSMHSIYEANGLHLYPQASYWDWPYSADSAHGKRLLQVERDWIWFKEWSRYAWKSNRNRNDEVVYWSSLLAGKFGCTVEQGKQILEAYEQSGEIAPKLLRRFGITDGNRQTLTLGMLMTQLINPYRYGLFELLYESESPEGEMLIEYAAKDWKGQKHIGETPPQIIKEVKVHGDKATAAIDKVAPFITKNKEEFNRLRNDMYCYKALAYHYANKAEAALHALRYKYSNDVKDLDKALPFLQKSVTNYKELVNLTKGTYLYANSMQTQQRKIPIRGVDGTFKTWTEVLVPFEAELKRFTTVIDSLKSQPAAAVKKTVTLANANITLQTTYPRYTIDDNARLFSDSAYTIGAFAKELKGLQGIQLPFGQQLQQQTRISFTNDKPVKVLVGFFNKKEPAFSKAPELETDASANDFGQADTKIANALFAKGLPLINVHTYSFKAGNNTLVLAKGAVLVLGFIDDTTPMPVYDAGISEKGVTKEIDWLFE
jgi:hypothetical protein